MKSARLLLFAVSLLLAASQSALGSCVFEPRKLTKAEVKTAIANEFNESASVFAGEVISQNTFFVKFRIITMWKGLALEEFIMSTGAVKTGEDSYNTSSVYYNFNTGQKYLVYARWGEGNQVVARICTRTGELSSAQTDIEQLEQLNPSAYHAPAPFRSDYFKAGLE